MKKDIQEEPENNKNSEIALWKDDEEKNKAKTLSESGYLGKSSIGNLNDVDLLCMVIFSALGYDFASSTTLIDDMRKLNPKGRCALRDSWGIGCQTLLNLSTGLKQKNLLSSWYFVHILLTDGKDTCSNLSGDKMIELIKLIDVGIPSQLLKTIIIGIDVEDDDEKEIKGICDTNKKNIDFYNVKEMQIESIFSKIQITLGIQQKTDIVSVGNDEIKIAFVQKEFVPVIQIEKRRFVVLFNIQTSASMEGSKWEKVIKSVEGFLNHLGNGFNFINAFFFNDKPCNFKEYKDE